jgi:hypothetical protein
MVGGKVEPREKAVIFINSYPTVLADINAEGFLPDGVQHPIGEVAVGTVKEIDAFGQETLPPSEVCEWPCRTG